MFSAGRTVIAKITNIDLDSAFKAAITDSSVLAQIIDLNQKQLYDEGLLSDGTPTGDYAPFTIQKKDTLGVESGHVTLKDTGEFYDSMKIEEKDNGVVITADTQKPDIDLADHYPGLLGLTDDSKAEIKPEIIEIMLNHLKIQLHA